MKKKLKEAAMNYFYSSKLYDQNSESPIIGAYGKMEAIDVNIFKPIMHYGRKSF